jgi:hypothetical protein
VLNSLQFEDYIETRVLRPIGMTNSGMIDWKVRENDAVGYRRWLWCKVQYDGRGFGLGSFGQGGVMSSASDMAKYLSMMMNGQDDVIRAESKVQMMRPASSVSPHYGLGWVVVPKTNMVLHDGMNPGFEAFAVMEPNPQKAFIMPVNGISGFGETDYLFKTAMTLALGGSEVSKPGIVKKEIFFAVFAVPVLFLFCIVRTWCKRNIEKPVQQKSQTIVTIFLMILFFAYNEYQHQSRMQLINEPMVNDFYFVDYYLIEPSSDAKFRFVPLKVTSIDSELVTSKVGNLGYTEKVVIYEHVEFDMAIKISILKIYIVVSYQTLSSWDGTGIIYDIARPKTSALMVG